MFDIDLCSDANRDEVDDDLILLLLLFVLFEEDDDALDDVAAFFCSANFNISSILDILGLGGNGNDLGSLATGTVGFALFDCADGFFIDWESFLIFDVEEVDCLPFDEFDGFGFSVSLFELELLFFKILDDED